MSTRLSSLVISWLSTTALGVQPGMPKRFLTRVSQIAFTCCKCVSFTENQLIFEDYYSFTKEDWVAELGSAGRAIYNKINSANTQVVVPSVGTQNLQSVTDVVLENPHFITPINTSIKSGIELGAKFKFVNRESQSAKFLQLVKEAVHNTRQEAAVFEKQFKVIVLTGSPGIGKTTFGRKCLYAGDLNGFEEEIKSMIIRSRQKELVFHVSVANLGNWDGSVAELMMFAFLHGRRSGFEWPNFKSQVVGIFSAADVCTVIRKTLDISEEVVIVFVLDETNTVLTNKETSLHRFMKYCPSATIACAGHGIYPIFMLAGTR
ncbi:hypothetical protein ROZALSC1DRAFT_29097 [Rozella allomycis CSF55]|uniref:Uncharacterized protein n=1 Tax=Rozella allomycis (strain CSF55) TaxID=988480 RepID=A0A075AWV7_ROZAC|nr:hypothetical protein O9G_005764 [Rozella allomycis CSF55]RKP19285.1 hypothetical protein ROZALSC1DRAFT_29097 [Rozella allomycis CSF55]|eukprot:EPZ33039.1 hypothetical protein O9G_005764 [Rozella allomycis CSF55]